MFTIPNWLKAVGNETLSENLSMAVKLLEEAETQLTSWQREKADANFKLANEASANLIKTALAASQVQVES